MIIRLAYAFRRLSKCFAKKRVFMSNTKTKVEFLCVPVSDEERELDFLDALSYTNPRTIHSKEKKKKVLFNCLH